MFNAGPEFAEDSPSHSSVLLLLFTRVMNRIHKICIGRWIGLEGWRERNEELLTQLPGKNFEKDRNWVGVVMTGLLPITLSHWIINSRWGIVGIGLWILSRCIDPCSPIRLVSCPLSFLWSLFRTFIFRRSVLHIGNNRFWLAPSRLTLSSGVRTHLCRSVLIVTLNCYCNSWFGPSLSLWWQCSDNW